MFCSRLKPLGTTKKCVAILFIAGLLLICVLACCAKSILFIESQTARADAIVILGGDVGDRSLRAIEIYKSGAAPWILVTGTGDGYEIRDRLVGAGIPNNRVRVEDKSRNTKENAEFSTKILLEQKCKKVILVTSWYHSRRALACFKHYGGEMEFFSEPANQGTNMDRTPCLVELGYVFHEYCGLAWYLACYGIIPF